MKVEEAIRKFLMDVINFINEKNLIGIKGKMQDINNSYELEPFDTFLRTIMKTINISSKPSQEFRMIGTILQLIEKAIDSGGININITVKEFLNEDFDFKILRNLGEFKNKLRNFSFGDNKGAAIQSLFLKDKKEYINKTNLGSLDSDLLERRIVEMVVYIGSLPYNNKRKISFLKFLLSSNSERILLVKKSNIDWADLYSYLYFRYLAKGYKTTYSEKIIYNYNPKKSINQQIEHLPNDKSHFLQFFEIFDVLDEYHHADDILSRYLKLYQIIEYLLIRILLVEVQKNTQSHKQFIRELNSLKKYDDFDKKLFKKLFENDRLDNWFKNLIISKPKFKDEVEKYLNKEIDTTYNDEGYWINILLNLLYLLRNSIVHNKESERHLTVHTVSDNTINLLREIIKKFEEVIIKKMIHFEKNITYDGKYINLY